MAHHGFTYRIDPGDGGNVVRLHFKRHRPAQVIHGLLFQGNRRDRFHGTRKRISAPVEIPQNSPGLIFFKSPRGLKGHWIPSPHPGHPESAPTSTPRTAPMLISPLARSASNLSNTGSPNPGGILGQESPQYRQRISPQQSLLIFSSIFKTAFLSDKKGRYGLTSA